VERKRGEVIRTDSAGIASEAISGEERVPVSRVLVYASPLSGVFIAHSLVGFYLLKYATDVLLIAPAVVGIIFLVGRVWDAITDPLVGSLSDRTQTRFGRRRPWFLASALPIGLAIVALWVPPPELEGTALTVWFALAVLLFYTAFTIFRVPHQAMAAELSRGYHDRTRVFAVLQLVESVGLIGATGCLFLLERADDPRVFAVDLFVAIAILTTALILTATIALRERAEFQGRGGSTVVGSFRDVVRNPHALVLMGVYLLEQLGFTALVSLLPYLSDYIIHTPGYTAFYILAAVGGMIVSIPLWVLASRTYGKKQVWFSSLIVKTIVLALVIFVGDGDFGLMMAITVVFGLMNGCSAVVAPSLQADIIDWDEAETGERKEGTYFAAWNFVQKSASGLAVLISGAMLSLTGFEPNIEQSDTALFGIRLLAGGFPVVFFALSLVLIARFSIDETAHKALRHRLK